MAPTTSQFSNGVLGNRFTRTFTFAGDTSYPAGGYVLTAASFPNVQNLFEVLGAYLTGLTAWDYTLTITKATYGGLASITIQLVTSAGVAVTTGTDVHTFTMNLVLNVD